MIMKTKNILLLIILSVSTLGYFLFQGNERIIEDTQVQSSVNKNKNKKISPSPVSIERTPAMLTENLHPEVPEKLENDLSRGIMDDSQEQNDHPEFDTQIYTVYFENQNSALSQEQIEKIGLKDGVEITFKDYLNKLDEVAPEMLDSLFPIEN